jgi:hypothetical protein
MGCFSLYCCAARVLHKGKHGNQYVHVMKAHANLLLQRKPLANFQGALRGDCLLLFSPLCTVHLVLSLETCVASYLWCTYVMQSHDDAVLMPTHIFS